jgi:predicted RNase H-like HicB family nuclease
MARTSKKTSQSRELSYTVRFEPAEEGGYVVTVPALPGVVTEGDTLQEARVRARDAIRCHLTALHKAGLPIPTEDRRTTLQEEVRVASPTP